jgi:hypothetical protein
MEARTKTPKTEQRHNTAAAAHARETVPSSHALLQLQRSAGNQAVNALVNAPSLRRVLGAGRDIGPARVHTGPAAETVAELLGADAFTLGRDIGFARGAWQPGTPAGRALLRHELAHVRQAEGATEPASGYVPVDKAGSTAERDAAAAERGVGHAQTSAPPAVRLRRAAIFGLDWEIEHSDVTKGSTADELKNVVGALTGLSGAAAAAEVAELDKLAGGKSGLLLRALDFLRDNGVLLTAPPGSLARGAATFCAGRSDSASSLGDDFYVELVRTLHYVAPAGSMVIEHKSGSRHAVPGISAGESDIGATREPLTSLQQQVPTRAKRPITGGFKEPLSLTVGFGTRARFPGAGTVAALVKSAGKQIDPKLADAVTAVADDKYVQRLLRSFLLRDGGKLVGSDDDRGHYDGESPPTITVGFAGGPLDTRATLVHELLHYAFDKSDSMIAEGRSVGGADHPAIEAIEARFIIIDLIRSGKPPLDKKLEDKFGRFLAGGADAFPKMQDAITKNDSAALAAAVDDPGFVTLVVKSGLLSESSGLKFTTKPSEKDVFRYRPEQFRDLAFIWTQNAAIVRRAMKTAIAVAAQRGKPLADAFATNEFKTAMATFLRAFVKELQRDPRQGPSALEKKL